MYRFYYDVYFNFIFLPANKFLSRNLGIDDVLVFLIVLLIIGGEGNREKLSENQ